MPWSRVNTEYSIHHVQRTPSTAYTEYCIHRVLHYPKSDFLPALSRSKLSADLVFPDFSTFPQSRVNQWTESQFPSQMPPDSPPPDWPPSDQSLPHRMPPSTPPILFDHGLHVYLPTRSITASKYISPNSLSHGHRVHLHTRSITVLDWGVWSSSRVCAGVCEGVSVVSCNETCPIDIRSIDH